MKKTFLTQRISGVYKQVISRFNKIFENLFFFAYICYD